MANVNVTISYVPHPNQESVINLLAELVLKQILKDERKEGKT